MPRRSLALTLLLLACLAPVRAERVMVGYYATFGNLPVEQVPWSRLTHLSHAYLRVDAEGKLVTTDAMPNPALTADGRKAGVPVLVTLGGGVTVKGLEQATASPDELARLVGDVLRTVADGRYDGVDVDWRFPRDEATRAGHWRLLVALRRALDRQAAEDSRDRPYLLTATVAPGADLGQWVDAERVLPAVDWLTVAAYDMAGPWSRVAAHQAPLFPSSRDADGLSRSVAEAMRYWEAQRGVAKQKLVVAAPLFGRAMPAARPYQTLDPDAASGHRALPFAAIRRLAGEGWPAEWDNECRAPWLRKPASEPKPEAASPLAPVEQDAPYDGPLVITYDDRNSMFMKATWAREQGYRGMAFWAVHQDRMPDQQHWLIDAANKAWPAE